MPLSTPPPSWRILIVIISLLKIPLFLGVPELSAVGRIRNFFLILSVDYQGQGYGKITISYFDPLFL